MEAGERILCGEKDGELEISGQLSVVSCQLSVVSCQ